MDELIEILEDIQPDADYETCTTLIDDGILDSFAILSIVSELEDAFDIRRRSFRRTLTPPRHFTPWCSAFRAEPDSVYAARMCAA